MYVHGSYSKKGRLKRLLGSGGGGGAADSACKTLTYSGVAPSPAKKKIIIITMQSETNFKIKFE